MARKGWKKKLAEQIVPASAAEIVEMIVNDITNRREIGNIWEQIDLEIREEIKKKWAKLVSLGLVKIKKDASKRITESGDVSAGEVRPSTFV